MKRVIITGPTGTVGMALVEYLSNKKIQTIAVVRADSARKRQIKETELVAVVECALAEMADLPWRVWNTVKQKGWDENQPVDVFYHFAWEGTFGDCRNDMQLQLRNISCALNAVDAAAELRCSLFIGAGSQAEYGRYEGRLNAKVPAFPENGYGMAKLCAGQMTRVRCGQKGIRHIWARICSVYGPYDGSGTMVMDILGKLLAGVHTSCTKGEQLWDYLYSKDAAEMLYRLGCCGVSGKTYCLGSGTARPLREYIEIMRDSIAPDAEIGFGEVAYSDNQVMHLCADITELQQDTGFEVQYHFREGIRETIDWIKRKPYEKD